MNAVIEQMNQHRSIRKYKNQAVPDEMINTIIEAGVTASSSGNMQSFSIIVTKDKKIREEMHAAHFHQSMVMDAPVMITFCADFNRMRLWLQASGAAMNFDNFMSFMIASIDATLVSQNVALAAESLGLGICYMGTTLASCDQIAKILNCPEHVVPVVGFSLGYPDEAPLERKRLPTKALVHHETYQNFSPERIAETYEEREVLGWERYMTDPDLKKLVEGAGLKNLAQVYTQLKYTRESHVEYSKTVTNTLREKGFLGQV